MFHYLYKHILLQRVVIVLLLIGCGLFLAFHPEVLPAQTYTPLYGLMCGWLNSSPVALLAVFFLVLAGELWMIQIYAQGSTLRDFRKLMALFWFLLFLLITGIIDPLSPVFFVNFIALVVLNINNREGLTINDCYLSGMLVGVASLVETSAVALFVYVLVMILIKEKRKFKRSVVALTGVGTVFFYFFTLCFLTDNLGDFLRFFDLQNWVCHYLQVLDYARVHFFISGYVLFLFVFIYFFFAVALSHKTIAVRKKMKHFHVFTLVMLLVSGANPQYLTHVVVIPFAVYYASANSFKRNWIFRDTVLMISVLMFLFITMYDINIPLFK